MNIRNEEKNKQKIEQIVKKNGVNLNDPLVIL